MKLVEGLVVVGSILLSLTCVFSSEEDNKIQAPVHSEHSSKSWKVEPIWEKVRVEAVLSRDDAPWPLLVPKRTEKTVVLRITYGNDRGRHPRRSLTEGTTETFEEDEEELSIEVMYEEIYDVLIFLTTAWVLGHIALLLGMPTLVGEIITGFLLGPPLADFVPYPQAMVLIGEIGLIGLLLEAGIEMDVGQLKETGLRSVAMALTGAVLPLGVGIGLASAADVDIRGAIALGASFSPTSLGVASNALNAGNVANTPVGQLIVAACVVDDIVGLILLSILQVLVDEDAQVFEYFIPIISSVGYLAVLGVSGLTWMPWLIEHRILPIFPENLRHLVAFGLMMGLVLLYLPLLNYSRSSYLTGAFLAGLTFSQIHSIHATFVNEASTLMNWLLRIFFAASIGFQVPITEFGDPWIISWGFIFFVCVLAKLPLGGFVPKFQKDVPTGFPYNPYLRDVLYVSTAMTCRGEFSFVIASFALTEGLFTPELYSAVVFAVLLSCVFSPFVLLSIIKHYNRKSEGFLTKEFMEDEEGKQDGTMPLYFAIQVRTPNQWGLQEIIHGTVKQSGLFVIDHRSWHPRGLDTIVITELYTEDPTRRVPIKQMEKSMQDLSAEGDETTAGVMEEVEERCLEVRNDLEKALGMGPETKVQVTWWQPNAVQEQTDEGVVANFEDMDESLRDRLKDEAGVNLTSHQQSSIQEDAPLGLRRRRRRERMVTPRLGVDMWCTDAVSQKAAIGDGYPTPPPVSPSPTVYRHRYGRRRKVQSDLTGFFVQEAAPTAEEHLAGFVRRETITKDTLPEFGRLHPGENFPAPPPTPTSGRRKTRSDLSGFLFRRTSSAAPGGDSPPTRRSRRKSQSDMTGLRVSHTAGQRQKVEDSELPEDDTNHASNVTPGSLQRRTSDEVLHKLTK